jgi:hypothetical protein
MPKLAGNSSGACAASAPALAAASWSSPTTPDTITPLSMLLGAGNMIAPFHLHFLPPYSPNLNPIERVWKLLRRLWIHNRYFTSLLELSQIVDAQFAVWQRPSPVLKRLCSI